VQESKPAPPATTSAAVERDQRLLQEFNEHEKTVDKKTAEKSAPVTAPPVKPEPEKVARASEHGAWAVQVASFSVRTTSERIAAELKQKGYPAFVTSFATTGQTMYRVRVGPVEDRSAAEALLKKIKPLHPGAAVVAQ
jgi:DedD protein